MGWTDLIDQPAANKPIKAKSTNWTDIPDELGITETEQWPLLPDTADTTRGGRSPMYTDATTGQKGEKQFNQFIPSSSHVPLPAPPTQYKPAFNPQTLAQSPDYLGQTPEVQKQMMSSLLQGQSNMVGKKDMFTTGSQRDVMGIGGDQQRREAQVNKPIEYLQGEMEHRSVTDPKFYTENIPRSAVRGAAKLVTLAPLLAGGAPAFLGYGALEAGTASLDAKPNESMVSAGMANVGEQISGLGRMLTDPVNIFERKDANSPWEPANTRASYAWDSPGEALIDTVFAKHAATGAIKTAGRVWDKATKVTPNQGRFDNLVSEQISNMASGGLKGKRTPAQRKAYDRKAAESFEFILQNKDLFNVIDNEGQRIDLPRNRVELAEFVDQGKKLAFTEYDYLRQQADGFSEGVKVGPIIQQLRSIIEDPNNQTVEARPIVDAATRKLAEFEKFATDNNGQYSMSQAQNAIKINNEKLQAMYGKGASYEETVSAVVDKGIAEILRKELDSAIESSQGEGYQEWKNKYGALKAIEEDINRAANKQRNAPDFKVDFGDIYTISKLALAAAKVDPAIAVGAGAGWLMKRTAKRYTPDPTIERTFKKLDKLLPKRPDYVEPTIDSTAYPKSLFEGEVMPTEQKMLPEPYRAPIEGEILPPDPQQLPAGRNLRITEDPYVDYGVEPKTIIPPYKPEPAIIEGEYKPVNQKALEWADDPAKMDPRLTPEGAYAEWLKAEEAGDAPAVAFWQDRMKEAVLAAKKIGKKVALPAAVLALTQMDDEERNKLGMLGLVGATAMVGKGKTEPVFYSQLLKSLDEIVPAGKSIVGTPEVQLKGTPEKRIMTPQGEKVIPAREGGIVPGKSVDRVLFELSKKAGIKESELRASGIQDALKGVKQIVNREVAPNEVGVMSVKQLAEIAEQKLPKLGEDVYGVNKYRDEYATADGQRIMTLRKIRDKVVEADRADGVQTMPSDAMDFVKLQAGSGFKHLKETYPDLAPLFEKYNNENKIASELFDKKNEASNKSPQFSGYQAIKSQEGVIPGSYTEKFVTLPKTGKGVAEAIDSPANEFLASFGEEQYTGVKEPSWLDEHNQYSYTKNPMVRVRYDDVIKPDGRKVRRLQEIQEPKQVNIDSKSAESKAKANFEANSNRKWDDVSTEDKAKLIKEQEGIVPQDLATRALDMGIKQLIADAKRDGMDGIEWSTGEQQRDLYDSALRGVADEARYNPETQELTIYKNGQPSKQGQSIIPKRVKPEEIENYIGKAGAERLLSSEVRKPSQKWKQVSGMEPETHSLQGTRLETFLDPETGKWEIYDGEEYIGNRSNLLDAMLRAQQLNQGGALPKEHIATDLSIDAKWPGQLYGDFSNHKIVPKKLSWDVGEYGLESEVQGNKGYFIEEVGDNSGRFGVSVEIPETGKVTEIGIYKDIESAKNAAQEHNNSTMELISKQGSGDFNYSATVPRLLKQYGKGEFGVGKGEGYKVERLGDGDYAIVKPDGTRYRTGRYYSTRAQAEAELKSYHDNDMLKEEGVGQPVMWFTKETPTSFPIYEGTTGIFKMLQEEIKKEGGKASGVAKVALKYGVPAALLAKFLSGADEEKKKLLPNFKNLPKQQ